MLKMLQHSAKKQLNEGRKEGQRASLVKFIKIAHKNVFFVEDPHAFG